MNDDKKVGEVDMSMIESNGSRSPHAVAVAL